MSMSNFSTCSIVGVKTDWFVLLCCQNHGCPSSVLVFIDGAVSLRSLNLLSSFNLHKCTTCSIFLKYYYTNINT